MRHARFLVFALLPLLGACGFLGSIAQKPTVRFVRVDFPDISFTQVSMDFVFDVTNPNSIGLDLATLSYQITIDGHAFVQGSSSAPLHLPAQGVGQAHVPLTIQWTELAQSLQALFTKRTVAYTLATTLGFGTPVGVLSVPLSTSGQVPVPQLPELRFGSAGVKNIGLTGADLGVVIEVRNPNAFAVPLGNLSYHVSVQGVNVLSSLAPLPRASGGATTPVTLGAHVEFLSLGFGVARAIQAGGAALALDGSLDLGVVKLPIHVAGRL